ncbi:hypothetical protein MPER_01670, partial [Moniliophthora perniciosa FA553]
FDFWDARGSSLIDNGVWNGSYGVDVDLVAFRSGTPCHCLGSASDSRTTSETNVAGDARITGDGAKRWWGWLFHSVAHRGHRRGDTKNAFGMPQSFSISACPKPGAACVWKLPHCLTDNIETAIPHAEGWLPCWQLFIAGTALFNTVQNYAGIEMTRRLRELLGLTPYYHL